MSFARPLLLVALLALLSAGCVPLVAWFPDGKKIAYTDRPDDRTKGFALYVYDVEAKQRRLVVRDTGTRTFMPAVSPDGKRIAVARLEHVKVGSPATLQVIVYGLDGKVVKRSSAFAVDKTPKGMDPGLGEAGVAWAGADRVLVIGLFEAAVVDLAANRLTRFPDYMPLFSPPSPVRPDDKGFLAVKDWKGGGPGQALFFVTWDGTARRIAGKGTDAAKDDSGPHLRWEKDVAVFVSHKQTIRADTGKGKLSMATTPGSAFVEAKGEQLDSWFPFPGTSRTLCAWRHVKKDDNKKEHYWFSIELHDLKAKKVQVLKKRIDRQALALFPSPDSGRMAIRYLEKKEDRILIIDSSGKVLADFAAGGEK